MSSVIPFLIWAFLVSAELWLFSRRLRQHAELIEEISKAGLACAELIAEHRQRIEALERER